MVIETRGQRPAGRPDALLSDFPTGKRITVVELANPAQPKVVQRIKGYDDPLSI